MQQFLSMFVHMVVVLKCLQAHRELLDVRRPDRPSAVDLHALALVHARPLYAAPRGSAVLHLHLLLRVTQ
jgi:hypothetical protein